MAVNGWEKNKCRLEAERVKTTSIVEDQISRLPDAVIGHILSFMPTKDAAQTCVLSKRWKLMWHSVPTLSFSDDNYEWQEDFHDHVESCLENRRRGMFYMDNSIITSFKLEMGCFCETSDPALVDKWLAFVVNNKVKEICLRMNFPFDSDYYYFLPETVVNSTYLTMLELEVLDLDTKPRLPALKTLSLKWCGFDDDGLGDGLFKFLLGCPSLEKLVVEWSFNLSSAGHQLRLQSSSLKFVKIENQENVVPVQVEATNLESLELSGFIFENSSFSACKAIRNLSLTFNDYNGIDEYNFSLDQVIANFPLLENLTLKDCYKLKLDHCKIEISNQHLKSFTLKNENASYADGMHIVIKSAPNLTSFCYEGNINFSIAGKASNSLNGKFVIRSLHNENYDSNWLNRMMIFLLNLNCSWNIITLHVHSDKDLILSEDFKRICRTPLLDWKHLRIITDNAKRMSELKDALMLISSSLETLSINEKAL